MAAITRAHVEYTIHPEKYARITKRIASLRRSTLGNLLGKLAQREDITTKQDAIFAILEQEWGITTMEAYYAEKARKQARPRRRRGQLLLPLL